MHLQLWVQNITLTKRLIDGWMDRLAIYDNPVYPHFQVYFQGCPAAKSFEMLVKKNAPDEHRILFCQNIIKL